MKKRGIPEWFIKKYPKHKVDRLFGAEEGFGYEFFYQVLNLKGAHISIIGNTRSGKTEKKESVLWWLSRLETIIEFDTGKPGDIEPFFDSPDPDTRFDAPVQVLIPFGCNFDISGVPEGREYKITPVMSPELFLDSIEPRWINIISLRNFFKDDTALKQYIVRIFNNFDLRARLGDFDRFCPCTLSMDEAHSIMGTQGVDNSSDSLILTRYISRWQREMAACKIRTVTTTQLFKDVPKAVRENSPCYIICRGVNIEKSDNQAIHWVSGFARSCLPHQGWFVINGIVFPSQHPMPFPHFEIPSNIKIKYSGFEDEIKDTEIDELIQDTRYAFTDTPADLISSSLVKEDPSEDLPDLGIYSQFIPQRKGAKYES